MGGYVDTGESGHHWPVVFYCNVEWYDSRLLQELDAGGVGCSLDGRTRCAYGGRSSHSPWMEKAFACTSHCGCGHPTMVYGFPCRGSYRPSTWGIQRPCRGQHPWDNRFRRVATDCPFGMVSALEGRAPVGAVAQRRDTTTHADAASSARHCRALTLLQRLPHVNLARISPPGLVVV
jgi:hypothetical protein